MKRAALALACGAAGAALAQQPPDAGTILRQQQQPLELQQRPAPPIRVVPEERPALKPSPLRFRLKNLRITGNTSIAPEELAALLAQYVDREVGFADLQAAAGRISAHYRSRGYLVARAYLPAQDIRDGVVEIAVIEGRIGRVSLDNRSRVSDEVLMRYAAQLPGRAVEEEPLELRLRLINELAGVGEARAALSPGREVGESDVLLQITDAPAATARIELDNAGSRATGRARLSAVVAALSPLGLAETVQLRLMKSFQGIEYARIDGQVPVGSQGARIALAYANTAYRLHREFGALGASGMAETYTASGSYPLLRTRTLSLAAQGAYEERTFRDRIEATSTLSDRGLRVASFGVSGEARAPLDDVAAGGAITAVSILAHTGTTHIQTPLARAIDDASARTHGGYRKWTANFLRLQPVGDGVWLQVVAALQRAGKNLHSSEKFVLGGMQGVRAYPVGEATGDSGHLFSAELRWSAGSLGAAELQPSVFLDTGGVKFNETAFAAGSNSRQLTGAGVGLAISRRNDFLVRLSLAARLGHEPLQSEPDRRATGWLQAIKYY